MQLQDFIPKTKTFLLGCAAGAFITAAAYTGHKMYIHQKFTKTHKNIHDKFSKMQYSKDKEINKMLQIIATIIEMNHNAYLSTIDNVRNNSTDHDQYPCCRMMTMKTKWKPPKTIPYIYIGSNNMSRKYKQIKANNKAVLTFGDAWGGGYVSLYGELSEINDQNKLNELYPSSVWAYPDGAADPRFVMFKMNIMKIEFVSHRFGMDSMRDDWKPFVLRRTEESKQFEKAEWFIEDKAKKWRMDYSGYMVFDNEVKE